MDKFTTISVSVTEEIEPSKVLTFIRTQIQLKHPLTTQNSYFYFRFLPQVLKYEIILFQTGEDIDLSKLFSFSKLCEEKDQFTLFITSNFFTLYQKKELLVVKKISDTSLEDIKSYIDQTYKIKPSKICFINSSQLKELMNDNTISTSLHKVVLDNSFRYFTLYLIFICFAFLLFSYDKYIVKPTQKDSNHIKKYSILSKEEQRYQKHTNKKISQKVTQFLEYIKTKNIEFKSIGYLGSNLNIQLVSKDKKELLKVLEYSKKRLTLKSIKLDTHLEKYIMEITLYD